jgi:DNA-binding MurR/RpiR family transcriptional regulator
VRPAAAKSNSYEPLRLEIVERFPSLSKRLQQIASYALDHPDELALETIAEIAARAGVQPSSLIRFAKAFGFSGYRDLQRVFRLRLTDALPNYRERLESLAGGNTPNFVGRSAAALLDQFVEAEVAGLRQLQRQKRLGAQLEQSFELVTNAERVYLVAHRRSFPIAYYLAYVLGQLNIPSTLVDGVGGLFELQASQAGRRDVMLAVSFKAYSPDVVVAVRAAQQRGVKIIAMTDGPLSPLAEHADVRLEVQQAAVGSFRSLGVSMTLAVAWSVGLGRAIEARRHARRRRSKRPLAK